MGVIHATGWALPVEDFFSSPFFDGITSRANKHEYMYQVLERFKSHNINDVLGPDDLPIWLKAKFNNNDETLALILREDGRETLNHLIEFVGPTPDDTTHVFMWPSWYGRSKCFRSRCEIDHILYGDSDFLIKESNPSSILYGKCYMDENGVEQNCSIFSDQHQTFIDWNPEYLAIRYGVPRMLRAWNNHVGLLDLPRIARIKFMAARYWG